MKILLNYQILCTFCNNPFKLQDVGIHESGCLKVKCSNELCGVSLESLANPIKFTVNGETMVACSKKCKKVSKFGQILRRNSETEVLKAFEAMMMKKISKRS